MLAGGFLRYLADLTLRCLMETLSIDRESLVIEGEENSGDRWVHSYLFGSISKYDFEGSDNDIRKCNFALQESWNWSGINGLEMKRNYDGSCNEKVTNVTFQANFFCIWLADLQVGLWPTR